MISKGCLIEIINHLLIGFIPFQELPLPIDPAMFPSWPAKSELGARKAMAASPKPPSGGSQFKQLHGADDQMGFHLGVNGIMDGHSRALAMGPGFSLKF